MLAAKLGRAKDGIAEAGLERREQCGVIERHRMNFLSWTLPPAGRTSYRPSLRSLHPCV
jgi:hypothetical protein